MTSLTVLPLEPGTEVAGFRIERAIGGGSLGVVYEATQVSLDRRVALRLVPPDPSQAERFRRLRWPEHQHAVSMYAAGVCEHGQFVAMQLVPGSTLAELSDTRLEAVQALDVLDRVATALDAAHAAGIVHGAVNARNVLLDDDGRAFLTDFGLGSAEATETSDRQAFAALVRECLGDDVPVLQGAPSATAVVESAATSLPPATVRRRRLGGIVAGICLAVVAACAVIFIGADEEREAIPAISSGTQPIGSSLSGSGVSSVDCQARAPSGSSQACTLVQMRLPGYEVAARSDGIIRRWTVRGARGTLALHVIRRRGDEFASVGRTEYRTIHDSGVHALAARLPVRAGDHVGLEVTPGAAVGVRSPSAETTTARWFGPLNWRSRPIERGAGSGFDREVLLRVEYQPGARLSSPEPLTGRRAERASPGTQLDARDVALAGGTVREVAVVRLPDRIAIDLFAGKRRLERLTVVAADRSGTLLEVTRLATPVVTVNWRNPNGEAISRDYAVDAKSIEPR